MASSAVGIPDRRYYGDPQTISPGLLEFVVQRHLARRAGPHFDVRFGDPRGLFSWVTRKGLPSPGGRVLLKQQPMHSYKYKDFEGTIPEGYGAGTVKTHQAGQILVTKASPGMIHFTMASQRNPERFVLLRPERWVERDWLLVNVTPTEPVPYEKVRYKKLPAEEVDKYIEQMQQGDSVEAKVDGASSLIRLLKDGVEVTSYRTSKETGRPISHTEKLFHGNPQLNIPPELVGTVLKGETYATRPTDRSSLAGRLLAHQNGDQVLSPQELGGLLNATIANSIQMQKDKNVKLKTMLYDIQQHGRKPVDWQTVPRAERRRLLGDVLKHLPADTFHLSSEATTPEEAKALWQQIRSQQHPMTNEGVVIWPQAGRPMKGKLFDDYDVHVVDTFPGEGKYQGVGAGGFTYALEPGGRPVGRVGTGFSDEARQDMFANPQNYRGRVARIRSQEQFPTGAYRAPAYLALHEDYPTAAKIAEVTGDEVGLAFHSLGELGICTDEEESDCSR